VTHILQYLKGTLDFELFYQRQSLPNPHGFTTTASALQCSGFIDADWAACKDSQRSTDGYLFVLSSAAITWSSKRQPTVLTSTTEAEYRALADGTKDAVYLKRLLAELAFPIPSTIPVDCHSHQVTSSLTDSGITELDLHLHCDDSSAFKLAHNPVFHACSEHIELHYHL
jgi:hypothetical protein